MHRACGIAGMTADTIPEHNEPKSFLAAMAVGRL